MGEPKRLGEILSDIMQDNENTLVRNERVFSAMTDFISNKGRHLCRRCGLRPAIKSRPVCAECHRIDGRKNYAKRKREHESWKQKNLLYEHQTQGQ
jgi:hypothetical protein